MEKSTQLQREEQTIDATDKSLGRLASDIAVLLMGKHRPSYEPHIDGGARVIVKNISFMKLTGKKAEQKIYYRNTGYPGGIRTTLSRDLLQNDPAKLLRMSVRKMLPDNKLRNNMLKRLIIQ